MVDVRIPGLSRVRIRIHGTEGHRINVNNLNCRPVKTYRCIEGCGARSCRRGCGDWRMSFAACFDRGCDYWSHGMLLGAGVGVSVAVVFR